MREESYRVPDTDVVALSQYPLGEVKMVIPDHFVNRRLGDIDVVGLAEYINTSNSLMLEYEEDKPVSVATPILTGWSIASKTPNVRVNDPRSLEGHIPEDVLESAITQQVDKIKELVKVRLIVGSSILGETTVSVTEGEDMLVPDLTIQRSIADGISRKSLTWDYENSIYEKVSVRDVLASIKKYELEADTYQEIYEHLLQDPDTPTEVLDTMMAHTDECVARVRELNEKLDKATI